MSSPNHADSNNLPISDAAAPVPVFDCHVLLRSTGSGTFEARAANLDGVTGSGPTERDALLAIVREFKSTVEQLVRDGKTVPFRDPPAQPQPDEVERWIPVHL